MEDYWERLLEIAAVGCSCSACTGVALVFLIWLYILKNWPRK